MNEMVDHERSVFSARSDVLASVLPSGAALLDMRAGKYFSLNAVGTHIWKQILTPASFQSLVVTTAEKFDVQLEVCRVDISALLSALIDAGLVEVSIVSAVEAVV